MRFLKGIVIVGIFLFISSCAINKEKNIDKKLEEGNVTISKSSTENNFPGVEWITNENFEEDGWSMEKLEDAYQYLVDSTSITGLMFIHKGKVIIDYGNTEENSYIASCRKSIVAMLYGPHVSSGKIQLDKTLLDLKIEDHEGLLENEKNATIEDIISARSGVFHKASNRGDFLAYAPERGSVKPGDYWLYSNWDFNVAEHILEQETGSTIYKEVENTLALPLQMQDWDLSVQRIGGDTTRSKYPAHHILFSTRDMARIGVLMLNKGKWNDTQVLEERWVNEMIETKTTKEEINQNVPFFKDAGYNFGYGYMWWLWDATNDFRLEGGYSALGALGQSITVFPELNTVIAYKTNPIYERKTSTFQGIELLEKIAKSYSPL